MIANTWDSQVELNPKMLAGTLGMTEDAVEKAIDYLCAPDMKSRNKAENGCRLLREGEYAYCVPTHSIYRTIMHEDDLRAYNTRKKQESRERKKMDRSSDVKASVTDKSIDGQCASSGVNAFVIDPEDDEQIGQGQSTDVKHGQGVSRRMSRMSTQVEVEGEGEEEKKEDRKRKAQEGDSDSELPFRAATTRGNTPEATQARDRLKHLIGRFGATSCMKGVDIFHEWRDAAQWHDIMYVAEIFEQCEPSLPSDLRRILKKRKAEYLAWVHARVAAEAHGEMPAIPTLVKSINAVFEGSP